MTDLVKLLRNVDEESMYAAPFTTKALIDAAADHIEQLEAALRKICDGPRDVEKSYAELFAEVCAEARAALAGDNVSRETSKGPNGAGGPK